jgi:PEP-CTERM motif
MFSSPSTPSRQKTTRLGGVLFTGLVAGLMLAANAHAGAISGAGSAAALAGNDSLQWGTAAQDGASVSSPYAVTSTGGVGVTASLAGGPFTLFQQGAGTYSANFSSGDIVLDTFFIDGPITIDFASAIRGVGFQIAADAGGVFAASLDFFGVGNVLFGTVNVAGNTTLAGDGSAVFLGGMSTLRDITRVVVSVSTGATNDLGINQLSLLTTDPVDPRVPEPATLALVATALAGGLISRRRQRWTAPQALA